MLERIKKGGRESSGKRMWNICTIVFRDQGNIIYGQGHVHTCKMLFFRTTWCVTFASDTAHLLTFCSHYPPSRLHFVPVIFWCFSRIGRNAFKPPAIITNYLTCQCESEFGHLVPEINQWKWTISVNNVLYCHHKTNHKYCKCWISDKPVDHSHHPSSFCSTDEHDAVQKKTFTKWINAQFSKVTWKTNFYCTS